jgi:hypothetical protein
MVLVSPRAFGGLLGLLGVLWLVIGHVRRLHDPLDYAAWRVKYQPRLSTLYFKDMRVYDPLSYDDLLHTMTEFSRLYQSSFLAELRPADVVLDMAKQRRLMHRHAHVLRSYLPNDLRLEKRLILGIEHTDGAMAYGLADIATRFPEVALLYEAGRVDREVRAVDDVWR